MTLPAQSCLAISFPVLSGPSLAELRNYQEFAAACWL